MENFFSLRAEKQEHIINAALTIFGRNGYKKASISDIAGEAGIAKGMVMYYFGSKKNLYLYLIELCARIVVEEIERNLDANTTDFFDKMKAMSDLKIAVIKRHSAVLSFLTSVFFETDKEVAEDVQKFMAESEGIRAKLLFGGTDVSKFKEDIDTKLLEKFLVWASEGFVNGLPKKVTIDDIDAYVSDYYKCLDIMKKYLYKDSN